MAMPPKAKVTKEDIIKAAVNIIRKDGIDSLNARAVAAELGTSTQPIFSHYASMDSLKADVIHTANDIYQEYLKRDMESGRFPAYKGSGIAYIRFAKEEKELFRLLFMRDRSKEVISDGKEELEPILRIIQETTGLSRQDAYMFHIEMWIYVHGIATMTATSYLELDWDTISGMITDVYMGLKTRYCSKEDK